MARRLAWQLTPTAVIVGLLVGCATSGTGSSTPRTGSSVPPSDGPASTPASGVRICDADLAGTNGRDENGCWFPGYYFEAPPEVIPQITDSDPLIRVVAQGEAPMGIEGTLFFVRAMNPIDQVILARQWDWPGMEQRIPAGAYQVTIYARTCDANCGYLDPTTYSCTVDVLAEPATTNTIQYDVSDRGKVSCELEI